MKDRIDSYYYSGANHEFMQDVATLTTRFDELKVTPTIQKMKSKA